MRKKVCVLFVNGNGIAQNVKVSVAHSRFVCYLLYTSWSTETFSISIKKSIYKLREMFKLCYSVLGRWWVLAFVCVQTIERAPKLNDKRSICQCTWERVLDAGATRLATQQRNQFEIRTTLQHTAQTIKLFTNCQSHFIDLYLSLPLLSLLKLNT